MGTAAVDTEVEKQVLDVEQSDATEALESSSDGVSEGYLPGAKVSLGKKQFWIVLLG